MRTLSSTLLAAQKSASGQPFVKVEVLDMLAGVVRPVFTRHYTGSEADFHHAATMPADGSLVRAYMDAIGNVLVQRVASPGPGSTPACTSLPARIVTPASRSSFTLTRQAGRSASSISR